MLSCSSVRRGGGDDGRTASAGAAADRQRGRCRTAAGSCARRWRSSRTRPASASCYGAGPRRRRIACSWPSGPGRTADWVKLTWGEAGAKANAVAQALLDRGLGPKRPVMILSGNSIDQALLTLGAFLAGVPVVPVSPAYSLMSQDFGKVKHIAALIKPGLVYAADAGPFGGVLAAVDFGGAELVLSTGQGATSFAELVEHARDRRRRRRAGGGRPRQRGQDPVHVGLDGDAQGRHQHARDAVREPAEPGADLAVHGRDAAGARRLAARGTTRSAATTTST